MSIYIYLSGRGIYILCMASDSFTIDIIPHNPGPIQGGSCFIAVLM